MPKLPKEKKKNQNKKPAVEKVYPDVKVNILRGDKALTVEAAKKLLGWEEETDDKKFGSDHTLTDNNDRKIRLHNNPHNRPFDRGLARLWESEILKGHWKLNGETLIIGDMGHTISAQHRLVALVLAAQEWEKHPDEWPHWTSQPTMDCLIVFGIDESDEVANTIGTGKPQSFADVIYRSDIFAGMIPKQREKISRILEYAVKCLRYRTGADIHAYNPKRTSHADSLGFLSRHEKVLDCVKHIYEEDQAGQISGSQGVGIGAGYAAALMYLMACGATDPAKYREMDTPDQSVLDFSQWDQAADFWVSIAQGDKALKPVLEELGDMLNETNEETGLQVTVSREQKECLIAKAWQCVIAGKKITQDAIRLEWEEDGDGKPTILIPETVGGIDLGKSEEVESEPEVTPEEVEERTEEVRAEKKEKANGKPPKKKGKLEIGEAVRVNGEDGKPWKGTIVKIGKTTTHVKRSGSKKPVEVDNTDLVRA